MLTNAKPCANLNHGRSDARVRFCPNCGETVNAKVQPLRCASTRHDVQRQGGASFCVDCGQRLAVEPR